MAVAIFWQQGEICSHAPERRREESSHYPYFECLQCQESVSSKVVDKDGLLKSGAPDKRTALSPIIRGSAGREALWESVKLNCVATPSNASGSLQLVLIPVSGSRLVFNKETRQRAFLCLGRPPESSHMPDVGGRAERCLSCSQGI